MNIIQTILEGMLGGLTFGVYHHYTSMREMKKFNEKMELEMKMFNEKMELEMKKFNEKCDKFYNISL